MEGIRTPRSGAGPTSSARTLLAVLVGALLVLPAADPAVAASIPPTLAGAAAACGPSFTAGVPDQPWPLRRLRPDLVWPLTRGAGITVAVIDSGVSADHPALEGQVLAGVDLVQNGGDGRCDSVGHGTLIGGIIAGRPTANSAFHGISPAAKILPVRVLASDQRSTDEGDPLRIAQAIRLATDRGADVINLSLTTVAVPALTDAVKYAVDHDVVLVAASGNQGGTSPDQPAYPAAYDGVIAVAGINEQGEHMSTSVAGDYVDIAAPGDQIVGPAPQGGGYARYPQGGTSFATAYVSGVVALVRAYRPDLNAAAVVRRVIRTADEPANGWDRDVGAGVVNPYWAVASLDAGSSEQPPPGAVSMTAPEPDPLAAVRRAAVWVAVGAVTAYGLMLASVSVWRRGRRRGWRSGRPAP